MKIKKPKLLTEAEKKLKGISAFLRDFLGDGSVVRFRLSVKLYRGDLSQPKIISIQGERSDDGGWNTWSPRDKKSGARHSPAALKRKLASIESHVREYIVRNALDADWKEHEASLKKALQSGLSVDDLEYKSKAPISAVDGHGYVAHFCAPIMATAYAIEGAEALASNDLNHASHCVDRGLYWSNPDMFIPNPKDRFTERARTGGVGKNRLLEPAKEKVADLLRQLMPEGGWKSTSTAINTVANELTMNHSSFVSACGLNTDKKNDLARTIRGWVQADPQRFQHRLRSES